MKTILVTGATGTTGSATLQALQQYKNLQLRAMSRDRAKAATFDAQGIQGVVADFSDRASLDRAMLGVDAVYLVHTPSTQLAADERNAIAAARAAGVKHIVMLSVYGVDPKADITLPQQHAEAEAYLKESGIPYTLLRPHSFMQNLLANLPAIQGQGALYSNAGEGKVPLIDARDIGAVAATVLHSPGHEGKIYHLTGPAAVSYHEVARAIGEAIGKPVNYVPVPDEAAKQGMQQAGMPAWLINDLVALTQQWRDGVNVAVTADVEKVLGRPARSIRDFAQDFAAVFKG